MCSLTNVFHVNINVNHYIAAFVLFGPFDADFMFSFSFILRFELKQWNTSSLMTNTWPDIIVLQTTGTCHRWMYMFIFKYNEVVKRWF